MWRQKTQAEGSNMALTRDTLINMHVSVRTFFFLGGGVQSYTILVEFKNVVFCPDKLGKQKNGITRETSHEHN